MAVLTDSPNPRKYWSVLKTRLKKEGSELTTNCSQLKMRSADGKMYLTDVADTEKQSVTNALSANSLRFAQIYFFAMCLYYEERTSWLPAGF